MRYTQESIKNLLLNNPRAVHRGIVAIFRGQTALEQAGNHTGELNGRGFNRTDAAYGSYLARWVLSGRELSGNHFEQAKRMTMFYSRQLMEIANANDLSSNKRSFSKMEKSPDTERSAIQSP